MLRALRQFGFGSLGLTVEDFSESDQIIQLGNPPNRIELFTFMQGVDFKQCYAKRVKTKMDDVIVNFIDLESLKKNKRTVGRHRDLADVEELDE